MIRKVYLLALLVVPVSILPTGCSFLRSGHQNADTAPRSGPADTDIEVPPDFDRSTTDDRTKKETDDPAAESDKTEESPSETDGDRKDPSSDESAPEPTTTPDK